MSDEIEIPPSAWELKSWFSTKPSDEIVDEIKLYIKSHGTPHLWRGHTHSSPPKDSPIVYVAEVSLPATHSGELNHHRWAPCPICSPRHPKFYKLGLIAWFPEEGAIRIIGPECFAAFNSEGHAAAYKAFQEEQARKQTEAFLLSHLGSVHDAVAVIERDFPTLKEIDRVRDIIARRLPVICNFDFWQHVRANQRLQLAVSRQSVVRDRNGDEREVTIHDLQNYGPVLGHLMLDPKAKRIFDRADVCRTKLKLMDFGHGYEQHLSTLTPEEKKKLASSLEREAKTIHALYAEANEVRRFLRAENVATLKGWGKHPDAPTQLHFAFGQDGELQIGRTEDNYRSMAIRPEFWSVLRTITLLAGARRAAE